MEIQTKEAYKPYGKDDDASGTIDKLDRKDVMRKQDALSGWRGLCGLILGLHCEVTAQDYGSTWIVAAVY
ncbi:hypothetical protein ACFX13_029602 [Malus domestica]